VLGICSGLFPLASNPGLALGILGFVGKGADSFVKKLGGGGDGWRFFFFFFRFLWSYGLPITTWNSEVASPDAWLVSSILVSSVHRAGCNWDLK
jgi:hypothetical protein